jgi:hypothetical protein
VTPSPLAVLIIGVTPEGTGIINWLKKCCGARFANTTAPTTHGGAPALPFYIERSAIV